MKALANLTVDSGDDFLQKVFGVVNELAQSVNFLKDRFIGNVGLWSPCPSDRTFISLTVGTT
jgi:hypothetical protein